MGDIVADGVIGTPFLSVPEKHGFSVSGIEPLHGVGSWQQCRRYAISVGA